MPDSINSQDSGVDSDNEIRAFISNPESLEARADARQLPDLTKVTSTSLAGLVAEGVLETMSTKALSDEESAPGEYGSTIDRAVTGASVATENGGYLVPKNQLIVTLVCVFSLTFIASLDGTILSTLMTDIASDLNAIPYISWIATAYLLSTSIVQPLGNLSDLFGRKPMLLICIFVFTIGCVQCATAANTAGFVLGRFLAGFSGGLNTLGTIIMSDLIPLRKRGVFQGIANMFFALGSAIGGTFGGWVAHQWGWRMAFWCQVPVGVICFFLIVFNLHLPPLTAEGSHDTFVNKLKRVDVTGICLLALTLFLFILMTSFHFESTELLMCFLLVFAASLIAFLYTEFTVDLPIVPLHLLKDRSVFGCSMANCTGTMYSFALMYYFPIYLSTLCNLNTQELGIRMVPMIVAMSLSSVGAGYYMKATGKYWAFSVWIGVLGMLGIAIILWRTYPFGLHMIPGLFEQYTLTILPTFSFAAVLTVTLLALIAAVPPQYQASVTSIQYAFRGIGSVLGTTIASRIFTTNLVSNMASKLAAVKPKDYTKKQLAALVDKAIHNASFINSAKAPAWSVHAMLESYSIGCWWAFVFAMVCSILCLVSLVTIKEYKLYSTVKRTH